MSNMGVFLIREGFMHPSSFESISRCFSTNYFSSELITKNIRSGTFGRSYASSDLVSFNLDKSLAFFRFSYCFEYFKNNI